MRSIPVILVVVASVGLATVERCKPPSLKRIRELKKVKCGHCLDMTEVRRVKSLDCAEFLEKYAFVGKPIIVTDALRDWTALNMASNITATTQDPTGSYVFPTIWREFFETASTNSTVDTDFSGFHNSLEEANEFGAEAAEKYPDSKAFFTAKDDVLMKSVWYVNWITEGGRALKRINRWISPEPYFFPKGIEVQSHIWFFFAHHNRSLDTEAAPGNATRPLPGWARHSDHVGTSGTWQAQLLGSKLWTLWPPKECMDVCTKEIKFTMHPGEMILINTDMWEHETRIPANPTGVSPFSFAFSKEMDLPPKGEDFTPYKYTFVTDQNMPPPGYEGEDVNGTERYKSEFELADEREGLAEDDGDQCPTMDGAWVFGPSWLLEHDTFP